MERNPKKIEAIEKLKNEMNEHKEDSYVQEIGQFLIQQTERNENTAEAILISDKTIKKSLEAMKNEAKKKAVNGFAMFTPDEGFALVLKYYDIKLERIEVFKNNVTVKNSSRFDVKLDDFL